MNTRWAKCFVLYNLYLSCNLWRENPKFTFAAGNMWEEKYTEIINHNILMSHPFAKIAFRQMKWKVLPGDKITGTWNLIIAWIKRGKPYITEKNQNFRNSFSSFISLFNCRKSLFQSLDDSEITHLCFYFGKRRKVQTLTWMAGSLQIRSSNLRKKII